MCTVSAILWRKIWILDWDSETSTLDDSSWGQEKKCTWPQKRYSNTAGRTNAQYINKTKTQLIQTIILSPLRKRCCKNSSNLKRDILANTIWTVTCKVTQAHRKKGCFKKKAFFPHKMDEYCRPTGLLDAALTLTERLALDTTTRHKENKSCKKNCVEMGQSVKRPTQ